MKRRGRPTNFKMTQKSKDQIAASKTGQKHTEETKQRISEGVKRVRDTGAPIEILMQTNLSECGRFKDQFGYIVIGIPNPIVGAATYKQRLHVAIMEQHLGRKLLAGEEIHHWGEKDDNRFELLSLCKDREEHTEKDRLKKVFLDGRVDEFGFPTISFIFNKVYVYNKAIIKRTIFGYKRIGSNSIPIKIKKEG